MSNFSFIKEALFEHQFWLQILGDHGRFIHDALSPDERDRIGLANYFIQVFDELLDQSRMQLNEDQTYALTGKAQDFAEEIRGFKLELLGEHLAGQIKIGLPPTFLNHMVNEVEEYLRILQCLLDSGTPIEHPLHYHMLWLPDAAGHAGAIMCRLDDVEKDLRLKSGEFEKEFHDLHMKAEEFSGYTRTGLKDFPALKRLNNQAGIKIGMFMKFLKDVEELRMEKRVLGTLQPLMPDHMHREECYYLLNLSRVSEVKDPDCDPTMPRVREG
jgi:hypothetical protein